MDQVLCDRLLAFVREHLHDSRVDFVDPIRPLTGGAFSQVFSFSLSVTSGPWTGPLVLRLYRAGTGPMQPRLELAFQDGLARAGFPTPRVVLAHTEAETLGQMFTIVQRLPGRSFLRGIRADEFVRDFPRLLTTWPETAARLLTRLHTREASSVLESAAAFHLPESAVSTRRHLPGIELRLGESGSGEAGLGDGLEWLCDNEPPLPSTRSVVHGDLWPGNVLICRGQVTGVVDWDRAAVGDPALDVGFAKAGLALMPAPFPPPPPLRQAVNAAGRHIAERLHHAYEALHPISPARVRYFEALRCFLELSIVAEFRGRRSGGRQPLGPAPPWDHGVEALTRQFTRLSGVAVSLSTGAA